VAAISKLERLAAPASAASAVSNFPSQPLSKGGFPGASFDADVAYQLVHDQLLPLVKSINASGHKFGLSPVGCGVASRYGGEAVRYRQPEPSSQLVFPGRAGPVRRGARPRFRAL